jgi:hypothetical protein
MTVKMYLDGNKKAEQRGVNGVYLNSVGQGLDWANYWLKNQGHPQMFCKLESLPLDGNTYLHMVDRQIERLQQRMSKTELNQLPVPMLLQQALIESFPCAGHAP